VLVRGVRGQEMTPGEFRRSQNWVSSPDNRPDTARFVPPPVEEMTPALGNWEKYLHDDAPRLPLLVKCALMRYQFETIHPFLDGNGRLGRLFIVLCLMDRGRLPAPLLIPVQLLRSAEERVLRPSSVHPRARRDHRVASLLPRWRRRPSQRCGRPRRDAFRSPRELPHTPPR